MAESNLSLEELTKVGIAFRQDFCVNYTEDSLFLRQSVSQSREVEERRKDMFVRPTSDIKDVVVGISTGLGEQFTSNSSSELIAVCMVGIYERIARHYLLWRNESTDLIDVAQETAAFMRGGIEHLFARD